MDVYLHSHFGAPIGADLCRQIKALGVAGVRVDLQAGLRGTPPVMPVAAPGQILEECDDAGLDVVAIVTDAGQVRELCQSGVIRAHDVELRNEPDIGTNAYLPPTVYAAMITDAVEAFRPVHEATGNRLWVGSISNLSQRGLAYLRQLRATIDALPAWVGVSVHRYPTGGAHEAWDVPHVGFRSRADEVLALRRIIGERAVLVTETGYHLGPRTSGWWWWRRTRQWSEAEQAEQTARELAFWAEHGAEGVVVYQVHSPPVESPEPAYGWRRPDGTWRPVSTVARPYEP